MSIKLKTLLVNGTLVSTGGVYNYFPRLVSLNNGQCVTSWTNIASNNIHNVNIRRFDCSSLSFGSVFSITPCVDHPYNQKNFFNASMAIYDTGQYFVSWTQTPESFTGARNFATDNVCIQLFQGETQSSPSIDLDSTQNFNQFDSDVVTLNSNSAILTYGFSSTTSYNNVAGQAININFNSGGQKTLQESKRITFDFGSGTVKFSSSVLKISSNKLAVSWLESSNNAVTSDVKIQLFQINSNNDFTSLTSSIKLNAAGSSNCFSYNSAIASNGNIYVAWTADPTNNGTRAIYGQALNSNGVKLGNVIQISPSDSARQFAPKVVALPDNNFLVSWLADGVNKGIYAQEVAVVGKVNKIAKILSDVYLDQNSFDTIYLSNNNIIYIWQTGDGTQIKISSAKINYFLTSSSSLTDTTSLSQSISSTMSGSGSLSEEISKTDSLSSTMSVSLSQSGTYSTTTSPSQTTSLSTSNSNSDTLSASQTVSISQTTSLSGSESNSISASSSLSQSITESSSQTATLTGSFSQTNTESLSTTKTLSAASVSESFSGSISTSGTLSESDSKTSSLTISDSQTGTGSLSDSGSATMTVTDSKTTTGSLSDSGSTTMTVTGSISETYSLLTHTVTESISDNSKTFTFTGTTSMSTSGSPSLSSSISTSLSESLSGTIQCESNQVYSIDLKYINIHVTSVALQNMNQLTKYNLTAITKLHNNINKEATFKADLKIDFQNNDKMTSFVNDVLIKKNHHVQSGEVHYKTNCRNDVVLNDIKCKNYDLQTDPYYTYSWYHPDEIRTYCISPWKSSRIEEKLELVLGPRQCAAAKMTASFYKNYPLNFEAQAVMSAIDKFGNKVVGDALISAAKCIFSHEDWILVNNDTKVLLNTKGLIEHNYLYNVDVDVLGC